MNMSIIRCEMPVDHTTEVSGTITAEMMIGNRIRFQNPVLRAKCFDSFSLDFYS